MRMHLGRAFQVMFVSLLSVAPAAHAQRAASALPPARFELGVALDAGHVPAEMLRACGGRNDGRSVGAHGAVRYRPLRGLVIQADARATEGSETDDCTLPSTVRVIDANTTETRSEFIPAPGSPTDLHGEAMLRAGVDAGYGHVRVRALGGIGGIVGERFLPARVASVALAVDRFFLETEWVSARVRGSIVTDRRFTPTGGGTSTTRITTPLTRTPSWRTYRIGVTFPLAPARP